MKDTVSFSRDSLLRPLGARLTEPPNLIQVILGPRQVGKTTAIQQFLAKWGVSPFLYESADLLTPPDTTWIATHWQKARELAASTGGALLVLDEVQKVPRWSEAVKKFFDEDKRKDATVRVVLLGSSALMVQRGLTESLAGRFEVIHFPHWSFVECRQAFGWDLKKYLFFGGYPGGANLLMAGKEEDEKRWQQYIRESLIETVLGKDILSLTPVDKPALFRQVFQLACAHPAEILAFNKMLGQLQDAGNTTTIASYLNLLQAAQLIVPLQKYSGEMVRQRASSPKLIVLNNALINATMLRRYEETTRDRALWGRLVENAIVAHAWNQALGTGLELFYWREGVQEVDLVVRRGQSLLAIEIKSNGSEKLSGLKAFLQRYREAKPLRVGGQGADITLEDFMERGPGEIF